MAIYIYNKIFSFVTLVQSPGLYDKIKKNRKNFIHFLILRYLCISVLCEEELNNPLFNSSTCAKDLQKSLTVLLYTNVLVPKVFCTSVPYAGQLLYSVQNTLNSQTQVFICTDYVL